MNKIDFKKQANKRNTSKKASSKSSMKQNNSKNNLEKDLIKMNNPCVSTATRTVLSQRSNSSHVTKKPQKQKFDRPSTVQKNKSSKKVPQKANRQDEYVKLKAKLLNEALEKKDILKNPVKISKSLINTAYNTSDLYDNNFQKIKIQNSKLSQQTFYLQDQKPKMIENKLNKNSLAIIELTKTQKVLLQKLTNIQNKNEQKIKLNEVSYSNQSKIQGFRQEINKLNLKNKQKNNANIIFERKIYKYEEQFENYKNKISQRDTKIEILNNQNRQLQNQNFMINEKLINFENNLSCLKNQVVYLTKDNQVLKDKVKQCQLQKTYIKQNSLQVLSFIRQEFGEQLNFCSI